MSSDALGFRPETQTYMYITTLHSALLNGFHLNGHTLGFYPDSKGMTVFYSTLKSTVGTCCPVLYSQETAKNNSSNKHEKRNNCRIVTVVEK